MKTENERVTVHELRGFVSTDLAGAFQESYAVSRGTRCKQYLYSLSLNPPKNANPTDGVFMDAVNRAEERLGLSGQPRAVVFHEKRGRDGELRRHAHAVWCRIDVEKMKAVQMSYDRIRLNDLGRELYIEHGWQMPRGFLNSKEANPRNYSLAEWQQAKRAKKDPARLKGMFQECWAISDSQVSFAHALREKGYILAKGDRRGIVALDREGEVYSVPRYVGIKTRQACERVQDEASLPDTAKAHAEALSLTTDRLRELQNQQRRTASIALSRLAEERRRAVKEQREQIKRQITEQLERQKAEPKERQARIRTGWRGLLDRISGTRKKMEARNRLERYTALRRDHAERQSVANTHRAMRQEILKQASAAKVRHKATIRELKEDIERLEAIPPPKPPDKPDRQREAYIAEQQEKAALRPKRRRTPTSERPRRRGRSRTGPSPGL